MKRREEEMAEYVGPATTFIGKCVDEPIKRQFNYLCCFNTNIQNLRDEAQRLDDAKEGLQRQVEAAKRNTEDIVPEVETWLGNVDEIQENYSSRIEPAILQVKSGCLSIKSRFSLSRKSTKMAAAMKKLHDDGKFERISLPALPAAMSLIPFGQVYELKSRKDFEDDIMATLREKKVRWMGLYGMGGVGKTTMAKKIMTRAREEGLFDEIVIAVVSQPVDMLRVQKELAELLGLNFGVDSLLARAHLLHKRLMSSKSILIILDDLWEGLDLEELGIPKECTILLTSRDRDVFGAMNVDKTFQVKTLEDVEDWSLFKEKVGACANDQSLFPIAQEIVRECKGLPIAIVTVGVALKDKMNKSIWEDAVHELRSCNPQDIPNFLAQVYNPLKLSYDLLESTHARSIFLLCCLFPEDRNILISDMCFYAWGLGIFEGLRSLRFARNKMQRLVEMLKSRSLLLDGDGEVFVKMHDVVRDVGIFIAANKGLIDPNLNWRSWAREKNSYIIDCSWISLYANDKITLPEGSIFPNLCFLLIEGPSIYQVRLCDNLFESARKLCVLSIKKYEGIPHTIQMQKNMRTLILFKCPFLKDLSVLGELVSLEILYCQYCYGVKELPVEIGRLNKLKLLDFSHCIYLSRIPAGVISSLIGLEELALIDSFKYWELAVEEGKNAAVCELNFLSSLTTLKIHIHNASLAAEQIHLPNLVEFDITFGHYSVMYSSYARQMELVLEREVIIGEWIHQLIRSTESLVLKEEFSCKLLPLLPQCHSLKELYISYAKMITRLSDGTTTVFPLLESLHLTYNDDLDEIHKGPISSDSFNNLSSIFISKCSRLRSVLPWAMGNNYVLQLKKIVIYNCSMLEHVVLLNEEESDQISCITFPKLEKLTLQCLPTLTTLCKGIDSFEFPALTQMIIEDCPNMKSLVSSTKNCQRKCSEDDSQHLFCKPAIFGRLEKLKVNGFHSISRLWCDQIPIDFFTKLVDLNVSNCDNIKSLFLASIAGNLVNLQELIIKSCCAMVKVIEEKDKNKLINHRIIFPKLDKLLLRDLSRLTSLCIGIQNFEFPLLTKMEIKNCPNMMNLVSVGEIKNCSNRDDDSLHLFCKSEGVFGKLKTLIIDGYGSISSERSLSLWCNQMPIDFFTKLVDLNVSNCDNIKSLFSPSIAGNLVNLRELIIISCCEMVKVIEEKEDNKVERSPFINLEKLELRDLPKLKDFCDLGCALQLPSLIQVLISNCPLMERFSRGSLTSPNSTDSFKDLKSIEIKSCLMLEQVMLWNEDEGGMDINRRITFPKLDKLLLRDLPRLTSLCKGIQSIEFPLLTRMKIKNCPNMKNLVSTAENKTKHPRADADDSFHLFCKSEAAFGKLRFLTIDGYDTISSEKSLSLWCDQIPFGFFTGLEVLKVKNCGNTRSLFSPSIAKTLVNLRELTIKSCGEMVKVVEGDEDKSSLFIKLIVLCLENLPKLKVFCGWRCALQLPLLKKVVISKCLEMEFFSFGSLTTPNLEKFSIQSEDTTTNYNTEDLNDALFGEYSFHLEILFCTDQ